MEVEEAQARSSAGLLCVRNAVYCRRLRHHADDHGWYPMCGERIDCEPKTVWIFNRGDVRWKPHGRSHQRVVAGALARGGTKATGVNAEEFLLLDANGKARAGLGLDQNGEVGLVLTSRDGSRKLALSPDDRFAVKLSDQNGRVLWSAP